MTQIISVIQQKGGVGKSTLISCLAVKMALDGAKTVIVDTDPQGHCVEWAEQQDNIEGLDVIEHQEEDDLEPLLDKLVTIYDVVLIDTAGFDSRMSTYVINASNLVFIPTGASKKDVKGAAKTYLHVQNLTKRLREQPEIKLVMWNVNKSTSVFSHALETLKTSELPVLTNAVPSLTGFNVMSWNGGLPEGKAKSALNAFVADLQMNKLLEYYHAH